MGWGRGKGKGPLCPGAWHGHHRPHWRGPGPMGVAAEAAVVGGVTAAVVASTVARPQRWSCRHAPPPLPPQQVVVIGSSPDAAASRAQSSYIVDGRIVRDVPVPRGVGVVNPPPWKGKGKGKDMGHAAVIQQPQPLDVISVRLPSEATERRGDVTFFCVHVTPRSGSAPWSVMKRYNDFHSLQQRLGSMAQSFPDAPFPKKSFFGCTGQQLEDRRRGLEVWLGRAIESPLSAGVWLSALRDFLENVRLMAATAPFQYEVDRSQALAPPPSQSPEVTAEQERTAGEDGGEMLQIQIPQGLAPGQLLGVTVPDGRQLIVQIPEGMAPGASLELLYDSLAGTLTPLM